MEKELRVCRICGWKYVCKAKRNHGRVECDFFINYTNRTADKSTALRKLYYEKGVNTYKELLTLLPSAPIDRRKGKERRTAGRGSRKERRR